MKTFTFDGKKHTPEMFKKRLSETLHNLSTRDGWKYMGVWERSNGKERLHFHGLFHIPNDAADRASTRRNDSKIAKEQLGTDSGGEKEIKATPC